MVDDAPEPAPMPSLYDDPELYDLMAQMTAPADLPFYEALIDEHGGPVLELGCGTGRLALPLAARTELWALDRSESMVRALRAKASATPIRLTIAQGDMRDFTLDRRFATVLLPYNTFNHLQSLEDVLRCLDRVRHHLDEEGVVVIDTFQPDPRRLHPGGSDEERLFRYRDPHTQRIVCFFEQSRYDPVTQVNHARWRWTDEAGATLREDEIQMRLFFPAELEAVLRLGGFDLVARWGGYERQPFEASSPKQLCLCRPRR